MTDYDQAILEELDDLDEAAILTVLNHIMFQKRRVVGAYNKKVKHKSFDEGELVWKIILPFGRDDETCGK